MSNQKDLNYVSKFEVGDTVVSGPMLLPRFISGVYETDDGQFEYTLGEHKHRHSEDSLTRVYINPVHVRLSKFSIALICKETQRVVFNTDSTFSLASKPLTWQFDQRNYDVMVIAHD